MATLTCEGLSKWYGDVIGVNDLTVHVEPGITGLLGPNGAGKSTFMRLAMGLLRPSAGTIEVLDEDPWDNPGLRARVGFVPEGDAPWRSLTGRRCLQHAANLSGITGEAAVDAAQRALDLVGLTEQGDRVVDTYSRGMRQKIKFALALLHEPEVLILDEPLQGTDPLARRDLITLIKDLASEGRSVLVSTHILPDVESMTQRILILNHGRLMAHGDVREIPDMLEGYPRTIRVGTPAFRQVGAEMWRWESVLSLEAEDEAVVVRTSDVGAFHHDLQELLVESDVPFTSITALDESVEAIFRELVD